MRAEAAPVDDAESASSGDNDMSDEDSEKTQSHSSELLFSFCIACKQVRQCHKCYSESNGTIPELCAAFIKRHEVFVYGGSKLCDMPGVGLTPISPSRSPHSQHTNNS